MDGEARNGRVLSAGRGRHPADRRKVRKALLLHCGAHPPEPGGLRGTRQRPPSRAVRNAILPQRPGHFPDFLSRVTRGDGPQRGGEDTGLPQGEDHGGPRAAGRALELARGTETDLALSLPAGHEPRFRMVLPPQSAAAPGRSFLSSPTSIRGRIPACGFL